MKDQLFTVLNEYLKNSDIHLNHTELELQILSHPSYPSLHSVTGVLDHFNISNIALEVSADLQTLKQLPKTFITLIDGEENREFAVVTQFDNIINLTYGNKKKEKITVEKFLSIWSGIILVVEKDELYEDFTSTNTATTMSNSLFICCGIILISTFFLASPTLVQSLHFTLALIGAFISVLITRHELGFMSKTLNKFCTAHESTSCDAVLNSKGATVLKNFKLSDFSLIYFVGLTVSWLITINFGTNDSSILLLSFLTIPATLYSLYYQYGIIKKWCPLCIAIVIVLWAQIGTLFLQRTPFSNFQFDFISTYVLLLGMLLACSMWLLIKPLLKVQQDFKKIHIQHHKFKRNFELFNSMYNKGGLIDLGHAHNAEIILGNREAPLHILLVTNPKCHYCKEAHTVIANILRKNPESIKLTVRFNLGKIDKNDPGYKIACRIIEIYNTASESQCMEALNDAYKEDNPMDQWLLKWKEANNDVFDKVLESHQSWCQKNAINFTPALYINGRLFPREYEKSDLSYFIDDLIEQAETKAYKDLKQQNIAAS
ncbi:vitamin K epoxide reductase family protein [Galbibacter sp. PAP.153]|uniref:vitamin K epoxide reductase family protein n=1 Tax=Galbibacter sp. PAP.153 TaxID=3104623 RepID=UPI003008ECE8